MRSPKRVTRLFGDLKVRLKLMVLHNVFFLILAFGVYFALYPYLPDHAKTNLFIVLGAIYILAVLVLETTIMPLYVYRPLQLMLEADQATQHGDRDRELINEAFIPGDEIGHIMRSRNATVMELRKREEDLEEALRKLEAQDRLVSLGLLSASVAHELNTPLTVLQGSIEKLTETTDDAATLERLARMLRVTQRIRRISESLVDFSRVRKQHMEPVPLRHLIDEAWALVAIDKKAAASRFANQVDAGEVVTGNSDRLVQVFVNLLRNALYAIPASGEIAVHSKRLNRNAQPWISVTVEDNGPGIAADVLPDIFEAFVSTRLDAKGTGLGLTVAEGIIHQHGGTIAASNRPEGGACLEVTLPASGARRAVGANKLAIKPVSERSRPILRPVNGLVDLAILDDDPDFCNYLEDALKDDGLYSIRAFGHPDELFAACEQRLPDIVLLDMKMGEFKGDKVLEQLLAAYPGPVRHHRHRLSLARRYARHFQDEGVRLYLEAFFAGATSANTAQRDRQIWIRPHRAGSPARTPGPSDQDAARGARLVAQGSGRRHQAQHFADQLHRARRQSAQHRKFARHLPRVRQAAVGSSRRPSNFDASCMRAPLKPLALVRAFHHRPKKKRAAS